MLFYWFADFLGASFTWSYLSDADNIAPFENTTSINLILLFWPFCLSVCNVRAPYLGDWIFCQCFYAIWYTGHLWPFDKNFTEIVSRESLRRGVTLKPNLAILDLSKAISRKRCKIEGKLLLITNRKSHMSFRLLKSVTLNDLVWRNSPNLCVISQNSVAFGTDYVKVVEDTPILSAAKM